MFPDVLMGCILINMFIWVQSNKAVIGGSRNFWQFISGGGPYGCAFTAVDLTTVIFSALGIFSILLRKDHYVMFNYKIDEI